MKEIRSILTKINKKTFMHYLLIFLILIAILLIIGSSDITSSRYETETNVNMEPQLAFFLANVENQSGQIQLDGILPSDDPYIYRFNVSNFYKTKKANVDLKYRIEIITTTNLPLKFKVYRGNNLNTNIVTDDYYDSDSNGVYYRHLVIDDEYYLNYGERMTDVYTLSVEFPKRYKNFYEEYAGVMELVDIKINAEQVV